MPAQGGLSVICGKKSTSHSVASQIMRATWVESRGPGNVSQMHYARQGVVTEEMAHVAKRENLPESLVMEEVARGG